MLLKKYLLLILAMTVCLSCLEKSNRVNLSPKDKIQLEQTKAKLNKDKDLTEVLLKIYQSKDLSPLALATNDLQVEEVITSIGILIDPISNTRSLNLTNGGLVGKVVIRNTGSKIAEKSARALGNALGDLAHVSRNVAELHFGNILGVLRPSAKSPNTNLGRTTSNAVNKARDALTELDSKYGVKQGVYKVDLDNNEINLHKITPSAAIKQSVNRSPVPTPGISAKGVLLQSLGGALSGFKEMYSAIPSIRTILVLPSDAKQFVVIALLLETTRFMQ